MWRYYVHEPNQGWTLFTRGTMEECMDDFFYHKHSAQTYDGQRLEVGDVDDD